jgi:serine/threonine-protein kinase RsbW
VANPDRPGNIRFDYHYGITQRSDMRTNLPSTHILVLPSNPKAVSRVERFLEKICNAIGFDDDRFNKILVAATEAVNNGIIHGNKRNSKKRVTITCTVRKTVFTICVEDEGTGVDPITLPDPLSKKNLLRENGRGVFLMRSLMDNVKFKRSPGHSAVIMKMRIR